MFSHIFICVQDFDRGALAFYRELMPVLGVSERVLRTRSTLGRLAVAGPAIAVLDRQAIMGTRMTQETYK